MTTAVTKASFFGKRESFSHRGDSRNDRRAPARYADLPIFSAPKLPQADPDQAAIDRFESMLATCEDSATGCSPEDQF